MEIQNHIDYEQYMDIVRRTKTLNRRLRKELFKNTEMLDDIRRKPFYGEFINGMATESIGPFPEFILPTHPCAKTMLGYCSPCFFSKVPRSSLSTKDIYNSFLIQTQFIVDNFDDVVIKFQSRKDEFVNRWDITLGYACNGSFFSNVETTPETRKEGLRLLVNEIKKRNLKSLVYIETCVDDYLSFASSAEFKDIYPLLKDVNAVIAFGFESVNQITRNLIYLKDLELEDFEKAIKFNDQYGLSSAAFLYAGFHSMTQNEVIQDLLESVLYLEQLRVMPILMFPNLQEYTLTHLLYTAGRYNLIDPLTAMKIFENTTNIANSKVQDQRDYWLTGDLYGGPPAPPVNFFSNPRKVTCNHCTETIRQMMQEARQTHNKELVSKCKVKLAKCENHCMDTYYSMLKNEDILYKSMSVIERMV